jgi:hypothetical protein
MLMNTFNSSNERVAKVHSFGHFLLARARPLGLRTLGAIFASAFVASPAYADAYCASPVNEALTFASGDVMVFPAWRNDWLAICNINTTRNNVTPQVCFAWFSTINNAILYNKSVGFYYSGIDPTGCPSIPVYTISPAPLYVRIAK